MTSVLPESSESARIGLSLPPTNTAEFYSEVVVPAGVRIQEGIAAPIEEWGGLGGWPQTKVLYWSDVVDNCNFGTSFLFK